MGHEGVEVVAEKRVHELPNRRAGGALQARETSTGIRVDPDGVHAVMHEISFRARTDVRARVRGG
jgi:hypothetical protein